MVYLKENETLDRRPDGGFDLVRRSRAKKKSNENEVAQEPVTDSLIEHETPEELHRARLTVTYDRRNHLF